MGEVSQISEFGKILIFLIAGIIMVCVGFLVNRILSTNKPNPIKLSSYECGEEPTGNAWLPFNSRFYVIALVFLLFDVEMVFIFPWATVFGNHEIIAAAPNWGWFSLAEMFIFLGILILGLVYVWVKGDLDWIKPNPTVPTTNVSIPAALYEKVNRQQSAYTVKKFEVAPAVVSAVVAAPVAEQSSGDAPVRKPMFKPSFKKPASDE
ncbi:NADH-quinone oxidoreductase subunit A [Mucilaginibacter calamicampi]|uniref:NADH-quinone oxidoreductase subunit A n=1 Tax=Mucilaginibacter calamicampi TaxID=1302352 RepID=A0ABW2YZ96_9SPHI